MTRQLKTMTQPTKYRPINLTICTDEDSGVEYLLAELSEVIMLDTQGIISSMPYRFKPYDGDFFIYLYDSPLAQYIISNPEEVIEIDFNDFEVQPARFIKSGKTKAYFHYDYIVAKNSALDISRAEFQISHNLQNAIDECLLVHHTEMFFTYLFRYVIHIDYEQKGEVMTADVNIVFEKYKKLCAFLLMQVASVELEELADINQRERASFITDYKDVLEYGAAYRQVISTYVIYRKNIQQILSKELNDSEPTYPMFYSLCMSEGYTIALKRIQKNLNKKTFLDHEFVKTDSNTVIKLYPTPYCFLMKEKVVEIVTSNKFMQVIVDYFAENKITRVTDDDLKNKLGTNFIFRHSDYQGLFYYKKRKQDDEYAPFGEQDRTKPIVGLLTKGQLNFTLTNEI